MKRNSYCQFRETGHVKGYLRGMELNWRFGQKGESNMYTVFI